MSEAELVDDIQFSDAQLQRMVLALMSDKRWIAVEKYLDRYLKEEFTVDTIKQSTEFETIWQAAYREGGRDTLKHFFEQLEDLAHNAE